MLATTLALCLVLPQMDWEMTTNHLKQGKLVAITVKGFSVDHKEGYSELILIDGEKEIYIASLMPSLYKDMPNDVTIDLTRILNEHQPSIMARFVIRGNYFGREDKDSRPNASFKTIKFKLLDIAVPKKEE